MTHFEPCHTLGEMDGDTDIDLVPMNHIPCTNKLCAIDIDIVGVFKYCIGIGLLNMAWQALMSWSCGVRYGWRRVGGIGGESWYSARGP